MPPRITARDVARRAGVSQPTVSRVFTPEARVSPALRDRVETAARELGYRPNTLARSLQTGRSRTVGVVLAYIENPFYPEALERLSAALSAKGYHVLVFFAANQEEEVDTVVEDLLAHQVDGIILASVSLSSSLTDRLREAHIPFVLFNRGQENAAIPSVTATNFEGGRIAAHFLADGGHERIAHISGWQGSLNGRDRQTGFLVGLEERGLGCMACIDSNYQRTLAAEATRALFETAEPPDAIFAGNDHMAIAVLETLRTDIGAAVPCDVSVIGFDDVAMAAWPIFDLTTLRQPANRMVEATVSLLFEMMDGATPAIPKIEIDSPLIIRGSACIPPGLARSDIDGDRK